MGPKDGNGEERAELIKRSHDALPSAILTLDREGRVVLTNATARRMLPMVTPGIELRPLLEGMTNVEKVDRLLHHRALVTFAPEPGGPELHWMAWEMPGPEEEMVLTVWETDWNGDLNENRAAFAMAASHELRGPLTTLQGFAEILDIQRDNLTPQQVEAVEIIERTARHLAVLVDDVFDMSRNSFGELRLNLDETDPGEVARSVAATLEPRIAERGQRLATILGPALPTIEADEARLTQIVMNLVNNASVHNPSGTRIEVAVRRHGEAVEIVVADDGVGLPFDDLDDVFHSFSRGETAEEGDRTGSGIGLTLARLLVKLHLGEIAVESQPGEGTAFTVWLPVDRRAGLEGAARDRS